MNRMRPAAALKLFEDPHLNEVWVYPKDGTAPSSKPVRQCAAEEDFQTQELEDFQQKTEDAAVRALRHAEPRNDKERNAIVEWVSLHIIRTKKSQDQFFASAKDFNHGFTVRSGPAKRQKINFLSTQDSSVPNG